MAKPRKPGKSDSTASAGVIIDIRVVPRSSHIAIEPENNGVYRIKLTAPPIDGKANRQLLEVLAERLQLQAYQLEIASGEHARTKRIRISGIDKETARNLLS